MSHKEHLAPYVEMTELIYILNMEISSVFVVTFPGYLIQPPPTVSLTQFGSYLYVHTLTSMCEYVTVCPTGILLRATKGIVYVPFCNCTDNISVSVQIILTVRFARGILFFVLFIA